MKVSYIVALLMIVLIVGCAAPETPPAAPAAEAPVAPAAEAPAAPAAEAPAAEEPAEEEAELTDAEQAHIERLKESCGKGAVQLCLALKNQYGIEMQPSAAAEEPEATEEPEASEE